jgi:hypothetical protein
MDRSAAPSRVRVAVFLSLLLLFFGIALFSPLHKHTLGKSASCSFNNIEHQMVSLAEAAVVLAPLTQLLHAACTLDPQSPMTGAPTGRAGRSPPVSS